MRRLERLIRVVPKHNASAAVPNVDAVLFAGTEVLSLQLRVRGLAKRPAHYDAPQAKRSHSIILSVRASHVTRSAWRPVARPDRNGRPCVGAATLAAVVLSTAD
jgi:hypothetical protein